MVRKAVFLDRDGVINAMVYHPEFGIVDSPANPDEFELMPGVGPAVRRLNDLGFLTIVISNQPGVAKGKMTLQLLDQTKVKMVEELRKSGASLDAVYYCLHHPEAALEEYRLRCQCRKPKPGLLLQAAEDWAVDLAGSYFIGDGVTDVAAGQAAGCMTILVNGRKCYLCDELSRQGIEPDYLVSNITTAVALIASIEEGDTETAASFAYRCQLDSPAAAEMS